MLPTNILLKNLKLLVGSTPPHPMCWRSPHSNSVWCSFKCLSLLLFLSIPFPLYVNLYSYVYFFPSFNSFWFPILLKWKYIAKAITYEIYNLYVRSARNDFTVVDELQYHIEGVQPASSKCDELMCYICLVISCS